MYASGILYSVNKVARATKRPTRTFGDARELAPFEWLEAVPVGEDTGEEVDIEVLVDIGALDVTELDGEALLRAALIS